MSKYAPLENHLSGLEENSLTLSYEQLEQMLGFKLPNSAYKHRAWWSNGKKGGSKFWLRVGWMVESVRLGDSVTFSRMDPTAESRHRDAHDHEEEFLDVMVSLDLRTSSSIMTCRPHGRGIAEPRNSRKEGQPARHAPSRHGPAARGLVPAQHVLILSPWCLTGHSRGEGTVCVRVGFQAVRPPPS
jgi:hypothetical protein